MTAESSVNLSAEEPYVTSFDATVRSVDGHDVTLNQTYFYAEGGGQQADRGTLAGVDVVDVQKRDGVTVHTLAESPDVETGKTVSGEIDEQFRTYSMRAHTASHVVYGAGRKLFDSHGYGGFDIGADSVRLDFDVDADADEVNALTLQRMANKTVWDSFSVEWYEMDVEEASADDDIVFNLGNADLTDTVRIVEIEDWDIAACGGTHVRNTNEIGLIEIVDVSNPGANLVRVEYAVGPSAIQRQIDRRRSVSRAAATLDTSVEDFAQRAQGLLDEKKSLQADLDELHERLLDERISSLAANTTNRDGQEWLTGTVDGVGPNTVADRVGTFDDDVADIVALSGRNGSTFVVIGTNGETDANDIIDDVTDEFGGGGGGQPTLAQGGGLNASPQTVIEYLRQE